MGHLSYPCFCSFLELEVVLDLVLCTFVGQSWASIAAILYLLVKETNCKRINVRQVPEEMTKWFWGVAVWNNLAFGTRFEPAVWWELRHREDGGTGKFLTQASDGKWNANMKLNRTFLKIIRVAFLFLECARKFIKGFWFGVLSS